MSLTRRTRLLALLLLAGVLVWLLLIARLGAAPDEIAFTVNGEVVTLAAVWQAAAFEGTAPDDPALLERLIVERLLLQDARALGLSVSDAAIETQLAQAAAELGGRSGLRRRLAELDLGLADYRRDLRERLLLERYADALTADVRIDPASVREAFEANTEALTRPERWRVVLLRYPERAAAEAAREALLAGADPVELALTAAPGSGATELSRAETGERRLALLERAGVTPFEQPSQIFDDGDGVALLVPIGYFRPQPPRFESVEPMLRQQLEQRASQRLLTERGAALRDAAEIVWRALEPAPRDGVREGGADTTRIGARTPQSERPNPTRTRFPA